MSWDGKRLWAWPVAAGEVAELPYPSQVRSSHLAKQNQVILLLKVKSAAKGEWAVQWVSLRSCAVRQPGKNDLQSELGGPSKVDAWLAAVDLAWPSA